MIRLLRVELTRLLWRRAAILLFIATLVVPLVMAIIVTTDMTAPQGDAQAQAEKRSDREIAKCIARPGRYGADKDGDVEAQCAQFNQPEYFYDYSILDLDNERENGSGQGMVAVLGVLMFLMGTTFVGHDWNTGSMSNQLLFQPRRWRVWGAKALAIGSSGLVVSALGASAFWIVLWLHYTSEGVSPASGVLLDCFQQGWRGAGVAAAAGIGGYALTMLSRSTVFTLGVLFGVAVAGGILIAAAVDDPGPWDPTINASAVVKDGTTYYVDVPNRCFDNYNGGSFSQSPECDEERERSLGQGVTYLAVLLGGISLASAASFRRRDVP